MKKFILILFAFIALFAQGQIAADSSGRVLKTRNGNLIRYKESIRLLGSGGGSVALRIGVRSGGIIYINSVLSANSITIVGDGSSNNITMPIGFMEISGDLDKIYTLNLGFDTELTSVTPLAYSVFQIYNPTSLKNLKLDTFAINGTGNPIPAEYINTDSLRALAVMQSLSGTLKPSPYLRHLNLYGSSGNASQLTGLSTDNMSDSLNFLFVRVNPIGGNLTNKTALRYLNVQGTSGVTLTGTPLINPNMTYLSLPSAASVSYHGQFPQNLQYCLIGGSSATNLTGSTGSPLTLLQINTSVASSLDISNSTNLNDVRVYGNLILGGTLNASGVAVLLGNFQNVTPPSNLTAYTNLSYFAPNFVIPTSLVNQYLSDFWANRDYPKSNGNRIINLAVNASSGAPTGQGLTDKANLAVYRSPNNSTSYSYWTVTTK